MEFKVSHTVKKGKNSVLYEMVNTGGKCQDVQGKQETTVPVVNRER